MSVLLLSGLAACSSSGGAAAPDGGDGSSSSSGGHTTSLGPVDAGRDRAMDHVPDTGVDHASPVGDSGRDVASPDATHVDASPTDGASPDGRPSNPDASQDSGRDVTVSDAPRRADSGVDATDAASANDVAQGTDALADVPVQGVDASVCPNGMGTIAIVGGTSHLAFGASSINGGAWKLTAFAGSTVNASPALVPFGTGFLGLFPDTGTTYIESTLWTAGQATWSTPVGVPSAGANPSTELGSPALTVLGANAELVYQGSNSDYYHGVYTSGAWAPAGDPVGGSAPQDYGQSPPAAAVAGGVLYAAYDGSNNGLYVDTWTNAGGWAGAQAITGAGVGGVPPAMTSISGGGSDLMLVYVEQTTNFLKSTTHSAGGGWSLPVQVDPTATATSSVSLAPLANGTGDVVMVYQGTNGLAYSSIYDAGAASWSTPVSIAPSSLPLQSPPTVAPGVCGVDAVAALVEAAGIEIVTLSGSTWGPAVLIEGTAQLTYASIATTSTASGPSLDAGTPRDAAADRAARDSGGSGRDATTTDAAHDAGVDVTLPTDAGGEAASDASVAFVCPGGSGTVALVGGSSTSAFGATSTAGSAWALQSFAMGDLGAPSAIAPFGSGFLSLYSASLTADIASTVFTTGWSAPSTLGVTGGGTATEQGAPSLSILGAKAELVYQGSDSNLYHAEYGAGAWGPASDPVGGPTHDGGSVQDFSPSQPTSAVAGGVLYAAYDGQNNGLYVDTWTAARGWADEVAIGGAGVGTIPPTMVALTPSVDGGASPDLMLVFEFLGTNYIYATLHTPGAGPSDAGVGTWGPVQQINANANTFNQVALAALPGGNVELVYEGEDGFPYASFYTPAGATWSSPAAVYAGGSTLLSPPSVAPGVCGYDAIAALVEQNGVQLSTLSGGAWSTPSLVSGLAGMTFASVATQP